MKDFHPSIRTAPEYLPVSAAGSLGADNGTVQLDVQFREYMKLFMKYRMIIGACTAICTFLMVLYVFTATPLYTAESKLRISTYEPVLSATRIEDMIQEKSKESNYLETQIQEMRSYSLVDRILEDPALKEGLVKKSSWGFLSKLFGSGGSESEGVPAGALGVNYRFPLSLIKSYLDRIQIKPVRRTSLVSIEATGESPQFAALMANRHADTYIDWVRENRIEQQSRGLAFLRSQADELREKVADLERDIADYAEANSIVAVNKDENIVAQKMSQLNKLMTDAIAKRIEAEKSYEEAQRSLAHPSAGFDDPSAQAIRTELAKLEGEYQQLSAKFMPSYPKMQQLKSQIEGLKHSIAGQREQVVLGLKAKMLAAREEEKNMKEELEQQKSLAFELSKRQVQYNVLNRELTTSRDLLQNVVRQIKETSLAVESNSSNISVVDYALAPKHASFPRKGLMTLVGLLLGVALGICAALFLNYLDNSVRTPEDVCAVLSLPCLGVVPSFELDCAPDSKAARLSVIEAPKQSDRSGADERNSRALMEREESQPAVRTISFLSNPNSLAAEAYRTIRTGILLSQAGEPPKTILVSSAQSSEGKTTSTINLAASLASSGGRVVLIDADLRRPSVHKHFNLDSNEPGLVEVLTGQRTLQEVAVRDLIKRVTVIRSGKIPPNPAELLGSLEMGTLIDELAKVFDYVLIDSPPVLPVTDSVILSRFVDGVVLVVRGGETPRKVIRDARDRIGSVGARVLGVILNDVDITGGDYYYYQRYYHSYYYGQGEAVREPGATRKRGGGDGLMGNIAGKFS